MNFLQKAYNRVITARMNSTYFQLAGFIRNEYRTNMSQNEIYERLKTEGYDAVVSRITGR